MRAELKRAARIRRHGRVRKRIQGTAERPRLAVFRSNRHIYAQLIDDREATTLAAASYAGLPPAATSTRAARAGNATAQRAKNTGAERAVCERGGRLCHRRG